MSASINRCVDTRLRKRLGRRFWIALAAIMLPLAVHAEPAVTVKQIELKATPASDAKTIVTLPAQSGVDLVQRQGAWVQLKSGQSTGWAKLFDIRLGTGSAPTAASNPGGANSLAQTLNLASGNRGASVTTGVRGLDADMLSRAVPNAQEFATLVGYSATKEQSQSFARAGKLEARTVEFLK